LCGKCDGDSLGPITRLVHVKWIFIAWDTSLSVQNKNTFPDVQYNSFLSGFSVMHIYTSFGVVSITYAIMQSNILIPGLCFD